jgi:hypothetical protein
MQNVLATFEDGAKRAEKLMNVARMNDRSSELAWHISALC